MKLCQRRLKVDHYIALELSSEVVDKISFNEPRQIGKFFSRTHAVTK